LRYYISNRGGKVLKHHTADGREIHIEAGMWMQTIFNLYQEKPFQEYDINTKYYLEKINKEISALEPEPTNQLKLEL
jgi:hypothetical protein